MKSLQLGLAGVLALCCVPAAHAQELVKNGNFTTTFSTGSQNANTPSQLNYNGYGVTNWTSDVSNGYNFIFNPALAGSAGYTSSGQYGDIQLYVKANGGSATAPVSLVSPVGGNFLAADPAFQQGSISQLITGLTAGSQYLLSFWWAASQQAGFTGVTTAGWTGTLGNTAFATQVVTNPDKGFTPWMKFSTTITATSASETLKFLAIGGPSGGQPPFVLLDGVSLTAVPEPASWALMLAGFAAVGLAMRRRSKVRTSVTFA